MNGRKWTNNSMCLEGHGTEKSTFVEICGPVTALGWKVMDE
jgi:hypothetical protein